MAFIEWSDDLSVGVKQFDDDHKQLINVANDLHEKINVGAQQTSLAQILNELMKYTIYHFGHEEGLMLQYGYPNYEKHKAEHEALVKKVEDYIEQVSNGKQSISLSLMGFLKDWLVRHIMGSDMDYKAFFEGKGLK